MQHIAAARVLQNRLRHVRQLALSLVIAVALPACSDPPASAAHRPASDDLPEVLARIGNEEITAAQIRDAVGVELERLDIEHQRARATLLEEALREEIRRRMFESEAARRGLNPDQLIVAEAGGSLDPTPEEVAAWYAANPDRVGRRTFEYMAPRIAQNLREERMAAAVRSLETRLSQSHGVQVMLQPYQLPLNNAGSPYAGNSNARVTIVEFSDFECSYCARFAQTLRRIEEEFGADVRIVYRQFPLTRIHPDAFKAAEASLCAHEQERFWPMHDAMFMQQGRLQVTELKLLAGRLGLDQQRFNACLDTGRYAERVQQDMQEGRIVGVTGTPAVFVNGVPLRSGAQPYDVVAEAVREALARTER